MAERQSDGDGEVDMAKLSDAMQAKKERHKERQRLNAEMAARLLAERDEELEEERREKEKKRQKAPAKDTRHKVTEARESSKAVAQGGQSISSTIQTAVGPKYYEMAGTLGAFRYAVHLHPQDGLAATSDGLGSVSIWSNILPASPAQAASGEEPWQRVATLPPARAPAKEVVLALAFIPSTFPVPPDHSASSNSEVFIASASSDGAIKLWAGPTRPTEAASAPASTSAEAGARTDPKASAATESYGLEAGASERTRATGGQGPERMPRVRLTLVPPTSSKTSEDPTDRNDMVALIARDIAKMLAIHPARVRAEFREGTRTAWTVDVDLLQAGPERGSLEDISERIYRGSNPSGADLTVEELTAKVRERRKLGGDVSAFELQDENICLQMQPKSPKNAEKEDDRSTTELLAQLLSNANDLNSKLRTTGHTQRIRKARIVFVDQAVASRVDAVGEDVKGSGSKAEGGADSHRGSQMGQGRTSGVGGGTREMGAEERAWRLVGKLVDDSTPSCVTSGLAHSEQVTCLVYRQALPAQPLLVSGGDDKAIKLWAVAHLDEPLPAHFPPRSAQSGGAGSGVAVKEAHKDEEEADTRGQEAAQATSTRGVSASEGGGFGGRAEEERMASAALRGLRKGRWRCVGVLRGHSGRVVSLAISGGKGRLLVSSDSAGEVLLWGDGGIVRRFSQGHSASAGSFGGRRFSEGHSAAADPPARWPRQRDSRDDVHVGIEVAGLRSVEFVLLHRIEETWPVRHVTLGLRSVLNDHLLVLRDLLPEAWPLVDEDEIVMSLEQQLEALEMMLQRTTEQARIVKSACSILKRHVEGARLRCSEPALSDRALLRQWLRSQHIADNISPILKDLDTRRVQSLGGFRALVRDALALRWQDAGEKEPERGVALENDALCQALQHKVEFDKEEVDKLALASLSRRSFVRVGNKYYKPIGDRRVLVQLIRTLRQDEQAAADASLLTLSSALERLEDDYARLGAEAEEMANALVALLGEGPDRVVRGWRASLVDAVVPILDSAARASEEIRQVDEHLGSSSALHNVKRRLALVVRGVLSRGMSFAKTTQRIQPGQRIGMMLQAVFQSHEDILSVILKLTESELRESHKVVEYVRTIACTGCCVMATSCDDLPVAAGMQVCLTAKVDKHALGLVEKPVYAGPVGAKAFAGWMVKIEHDSMAESMTGHTGGGERLVDRRVMAPEDLPSQVGVKIWAYLPLQEHSAIADHHPKQGNKDQKNVEPAPEAIKRLLAYSVGDVFTICGEGYTAGWLMGQRVARQMTGADMSNELGNVKEKDLEMLPLSTETSHVWCVTHCIEFLHEIKDLCFIGHSSTLLAVASASVLHIFIRNALGSLGAGEHLGLLETYSRTRASPLESVMESRSIFNLALSESMWKPLERLSLRMDVTALGQAACDTGMRSVVAVGSKSAGLARVVDLSRWQAAVKAHHVLESWLQAVKDRRWSDVMRKLVLEAASGNLDGPLARDVVAEGARKKKLLADKAQVEERLSQPAEADAAKGMDADREEVQEVLSSLTKELQEWEEGSKAYAAARKEMLALAVEKIKEREPYAHVRRSRVGRLLSRVLRERVLRNLLVTHAHDERKAAAANRQLEALEASQGSILGTSQMPVEQQKRDLRLVFDLLDSDKSGEIDEREIKAHCSKLGIASSSQHELVAMIQLADANQNVFLVKGRQVSVDMADFVHGEGKKARYMGRRPVRIVDIDDPPPDDDEFDEDKRLLWRIQDEGQRDDPAHPDYLQNLRQLMGSINPKDWTKVHGSGTIDFDEFVALVIPAAQGKQTPQPDAAKSKSGGLHARGDGPAGETQSPEKELEDTLATGPHVVVQDGRAAFSALLRENWAHDYFETRADEDSEQSQRVSAHLLQQEQSPAQRVVRQLQRNLISTLDLRSLPAPVVELFLLDMCEAIATNTSLQHLHLDALGLGHASMAGKLEVIVDAIRSNNSLTTLTLQDNHLQGRDAAYALGLLLRYSPTLRIVSLAGNNLGSDIWTVVQNLPRALSLETLDLCKNGIDDQGAKHVAHAISGHAEYPASLIKRAPPSLRELRMGHNAIGPEGLSALMEALSLHNALIERLTLESQELDLLVPASVSTAGCECSIMLAGVPGCRFVKRALSAAAVEAWLARVLALAREQEVAQQVDQARAPHTEEHEAEKARAEALAMDVLLDGLECEQGEGNNMVLEEVQRQDAGAILKGLGIAQLQKSMQALRGKVSGLTSEQGIKVRRIQIRTEDVDNPDQNYARYLHSVVPTLGSPEDKEWWKWREFAAGQGELSPFPSTIAVSELDSLLRFVDDPEDAFLLLHWFPIRRSPESLAPARHREAIVSPVAALESSEEALGARNPSNVVGGKHSEGSLVASLGDAIKSGDLSKGGDGVSTQADANEGGDALKTEAQESVGMLGIQISRTASMAMFKTRPSSMVSLPRTSSQEEDQDIEQWIVLSDDEASAAVAQTNNKSQRLSATGHWGASSRRRLGTTVAPHRRSFFVQLDIPVMNSMLFKKWAIKKEDLTSQVGAARALPLAQAALNGSVSAGALGWLELKLVSAVTAASRSVTAYVWLEHRGLPLVQGPFRTSASTNAETDMKDALQTSQWDERFHFGWAAVDGKSPHMIQIRFFDANSKPLGNACVPVSLGLTTGKDQAPAHVCFGKGKHERAVSFRESKGTARDEARWFPLDHETADDTERKVMLQMCFRLSDSLEATLPSRGTPRTLQSSVGTDPDGAAQISANNVEPAPEAAGSSDGRDDKRAGGEKVGESANDPTEHGRGAVDSKGDVVGTSAQIMPAAITAGAHEQLLKLVLNGKGEAAAYRFQPTSSKLASWHAPLAWRPSTYTDKDVEVFEFQQHRDSGHADPVVFLFGRLREILTMASSRRSRRVLKPHMLAERIRPMARPTLFLSSTRDIAHAAVRVSPLDQIRERWHQHFWGLKDPDAQTKWHPPLVW